MSIVHFCEDHVKALDLINFQECICLSFYMYFIRLNIIVMTRQTNLTIRLVKAAISTHNRDTEYNVIW